MAATPPHNERLDFDENWGPRERGCMYIYSNICVLGIHMPIPAVPVVPAVQLKWCHEVLLAAPLPHAPGVRMT